MLSNEPEARIAMVEGVLELVVQHDGAYVEESLLFMRLAMISLTALSTNAVEIGSLRRRRAA
jgi:hypothetical protein